MNIDLRAVLYPISRALPNLWLCNYLIAGVFFFRANGRLPRKSRLANAELNDFIFQRMIDDRWSATERRCVDKELAKTLAARGSSVKVPPTVAVFNLESNPPVEEFIAWLRPYIGKHLIAKPTHGSGTVLFLDTVIADGEIEAFYSDANRNFFYAIRETQYKDLERKILVEENISKSGAINDYKFFCVKGHVLYCQVDVDRFTDHKRAICTVPDFAIIPVRTKFLQIPAQVRRPPRLDQMVQIASELSREFSFVRIDLYDADDGVYFGEYTLTPGAACDNFSDRTFANEFLRNVKSLMDVESVG
jgi:TupA-like ATPgrasp